MEHVGFNAWFGPLSAKDDSAAIVHEALINLGLKKQGRQPPAPRTAMRYGSMTSPASLPVIVGDKRPWCEVILHPIESAVLDVLGHDQVRALLMQLSDKIHAVIGRTFDESLQGAVAEHEIEGGPEWLDWLQYWGPTIVSRWGVDRIKSGAFRLAEELPTGGCAITLFDGPEDPMQMSLQAKAAAHLGIKLRAYPGRSLR